MSKAKPTFMQNARANPLAVVVQVVGLIVILANIWIASKLAPIAQDLAVLQTKVQAQGESFNGHITDNNDILKALVEDVSVIKQDVAVIKSKVE